MWSTELATNFHAALSDGLHSSLQAMRYSLVENTDEIKRPYIKRDTENFPGTSKQAHRKDQT